MASHRYTLASPALALQTINHAEQCSVLAREVQYRPGMFDCTGRWHCAYVPAPTNALILLANSNQWYFNSLVKRPCHKTPYRCPHRLNLSSQSSRSCALPNIKTLKDKDLEFANSIRPLSVQWILCTTTPSASVQKLGT